MSAVDKWFDANADIGFQPQVCNDSYMMQELKDALRAELKLEALSRHMWTL